MPGRELTLLTGEVDSGKTTWCTSFTEANPGCDGVLLRKTYQAAGRIGYDAVRVATGETLSFSRLKGAEPQNWHPAECVGPFSVSAEGKQAANRWLLEALGSSARDLIIDEIGPLELEGGGLAEAVQAVLQDDASRSLILVVRRSCLEQLIRQYQLTEYRFVEI